MTKIIPIALFIIGVSLIIFNIDFLITIFAEREAKEICLKYWKTDRAKITSNGIIYCEIRDGHKQAITPSEILEYRQNN